MSNAGNLMSPEEWDAHVAENPETPVNEEGIRKLIDQLTGRASPDPTLPPEVAEKIQFACGTSAAWNLEQALRNPHLESGLRKRVLDELSPPATLLAASVIERPHFKVTYTPGTKTGQVPTNIATDAADALETAYSVYTNFYGMKLVPDGKKCSVIFAEGVNWTKPDLTMQLSCGAFKLQDTNPEGRRLVCFHEAFHVLQFQAGYTVPGNEWFLEGTATWAEVAHGSDPAYPAVTEPYKLTYYWEKQTPITSSKYLSLPFFINLDAVCTKSAGSHGQVMKDIITTFKGRYPNPSLPRCVPDQIAQCAAVYVKLGIDVTIESLWVNWLSKMAQGNWNVAQNNERIYPKIYDGSQRDLPLINIPELILPSERQMALTEPNNNWDSESWVGAADPYIGLVRFRLESKWPTVEFQGKVYPKSFYGSMQVPLGVFEHQAGKPDSGTGPEVVPAEDCTRIFNDPQGANVYIVFVGEYQHKVDYRFIAKIEQKNPV